MNRLSEGRLRQLSALGADALSMLCKLFLRCGMGFQLLFMVGGGMLPSSSLSFTSSKSIRLSLRSGTGGGIMVIGRLGFLGCLSGQVHSNEFKRLNSIMLCFLCGIDGGLLLDCNGLAGGLKQKTLSCKGGTVRAFNSREPRDDDEWEEEDIQSKFLFVTLVLLRK